MNVLLPLKIRWICFLKNTELEKYFKDFAVVALNCHPFFNESSGFDYYYLYIESNGSYYDWYDLWQICLLRKKGWLNENGSINEDILTKYNELGKIDTQKNTLLFFKTQEILQIIVVCVFLSMFLFCLYLWDNICVIKPPISKHQHLVLLF